MTQERQGPHALKVAIPVRLHIRLRTAKILTGRSMSETLVAALSRYFERLDQEDGKGGSVAEGNASATVEPRE